LQLEDVIILRIAGFTIKRAAKAVVLSITSSPTAAS
jgi:hypothetical protein